MGTATFKVKDKVYKLTIDYDEYPENPRTEWDNACVMVCWHRSYNLGDKHDYYNPDDFQERMELDIKDGLLFLKPLYLYDHSGITISTAPFSCRWDSGQVGWIYMTIDTAIKEGWVAEGKEKVDECTQEEKDKVHNYMDGEVKNYDQYLRGEVLYYKLESVKECECCGTVLYENEDSCHGFFGMSESELVDEAIGFLIKDLSKEEQAQIRADIIKQL